MDVSRGRDGRDGCHCGSGKSGPTMTLKVQLAGFLAGAIFSGVTLPAGASTITEEYTFTAMFNGPVSLWDGTFTIVFDPSVSSSGTLEAFTSDLPSSYGSFSYRYGSGGYLTVGDNCTSSGCSGTSNRDQAFLALNVSNSSGLPVAGSSAQMSASDYYSINGPFSLSVTATTATAVTPIPSTLPLLASALGVIGLLGWRRKRRAQPVA
jgi:hypothetical protein